MLFRTLAFASALAMTATGAIGQTPYVTPTLRADIAVAGDLVRIGDVLENAGDAANIAIYRAPDPGTSGALPVTVLLTALRAHQVIAVDTRGLREVSISRRARVIEVAELERVVSQSIAHRNGLAETASFNLTFDRELQPLQLDTRFNGAVSAAAVRVDQRGRFDITLEVAGDVVAPFRLRLSGAAVEAVETAVLTRTLERGDTLKSADVTMERRARAEVGSDAVSREQVLGMQTRKQLRAGQALRSADLSKPELVQRDQSVTLIYETAGIYLTIRGKAVEGGAEGDIVTVMNLSSKRTVSGTVTARGQVTVAAVTARAAPATAALAPSATTSVALAAAEFPIPRTTE